MFDGKKVAIVMPAYNAAETLVKTYEECIRQPFVDMVIIVDDASKDKTENVAIVVRRKMATDVQTQIASETRRYKNEENLRRIRSIRHR